MRTVRELMRNGLALAGVFALGYWLAGAKRVQASGENVFFQLQGVDKASSLLVYQPSTKSVYLYQGAMTGNAALQCNYKFEMTSPGGVIRRVPCDVQNALR